MAEEKEPKLFYLGIIPKCPFFKPVALLIILALIALGSWGIYYFDPWVALGYSIFSLLFYFLLMPLTICKYCYFKVKKTTEDGKTIEKLLSIDQWSKSHLHKHVGQKNWVWPMFIIWFLPIVLTIVSFFQVYDIFAVISLIGFIVVVVGNVIYMLKVKCPSCPIREECHSAF